MKLICYPEHHHEFNELFKPYQHLDITLIEKGLTVDSIGIYFTYDAIPELITFLEKNFIKKETNTLIGVIDEKHFIIKLKDIIYIEGLNKDTFAYTNKQSYKLNTRLYILEEQLFPNNFIRISKSLIINIIKIQYISPSINGRLLLLMENNIELEVSRLYATNFKKRIGI